jgi:hypothetical protein
VLGGLFERLAEDVASGPADCSISKAMGWFGARRPTVNPELTSGGNPALFGTTSVSGPGQKASASR